MTPKKTVVGLYGVFSVGKSYLAHGLRSQFLDCDTITTDNLLAIARSLDPSNPHLQQSSYLAWKSLGDCSPANVLDGFMNYRDQLQPFIRILLDRAHKQRVDMIFEGIHISPAVFHEYDSFLTARPVLITLSDAGVHLDRIREKCKDRPSLLEYVTPHFAVIRQLQDILIEEAARECVPIIDNGHEKEKTLNTLADLVFS